MLEIDIPGRGTFGIRHVVCDYNGTIAADGHLIEGVASRIREIAEFAEVSVLTADTFGTVRA
ncbi:MAG: ATPase P, partial [Slackia isoflavoniconvertens]|nr:ATPase P [Slackia isoflavoniconvertens]